MSRNSPWPISQGSESNTNVTVIYGALSLHQAPWLALWGHLLLQDKKYCPHFTVELLEVSSDLKSLPSQGLDLGTPLTL